MRVEGLMRLAETMLSLALVGGETAVESQLDDLRLVREEVGVFQVNKFFLRGDLSAEICSTTML